METFEAKGQHGLLGIATVSALAASLFLLALTVTAIRRTHGSSRLRRGRPSIDANGKRRTAVTALLGSGARISLRSRHAANQAHHRTVQAAIRLRCST